MSADDFAPALDDGRSEYADSMHRSLDAALERAGEVEGDLAAWLRDWRLADCEHAEVRDGGIICCSPCLRGRVLASDWLAARDAQITEAAEAAAGERIAQARAEGADTASDKTWDVFGEQAAARLIASVSWPFERRENRESWAPRLLAEPDLLEQEYRSAVARLRSAYAKCFVAARAAAVARSVPATEAGEER